MYVSTSVIGYYILKYLFWLLFPNLTKWLMIIWRYFDQSFFSICLGNLLRNLLAKDCKLNLFPLTSFILTNLEDWSNTLLLIQIYPLPISFVLVKSKVFTQALCCGNHLSQRQMITQAVNLLNWISSGKFIRELNKESLLY